MWQMRIQLKEPIMPSLKLLKVVSAAFLLGSGTMATAQTLIDVACTGGSFTSKKGFAAIGETTNDFWNTYALGAGGVSDLYYTDRTPSGVGVGIGGVVGCYVNGASDPMYGTYFYQDGSIPINVSNLRAGAYNFYLYGHGGDDDYNTDFQLTVASRSYGSAATTNGAGWDSPVWQQGVQYVEFTNVSVSARQIVNILAAGEDGPGTSLCGLQIETVSPTFSRPFLLSQPADRAVISGATVTFSVAAGGAPPLAYQWQFNGADIPGATKSSYSVIAQPSTDGEYSIIVSDAYGNITNTVGALNAVTPLQTPLIDVAFTTEPTTKKRGFAATGDSAADFWNTCGGTLTNLLFTDRSESGVGLGVWDGGGGGAATGATDPMYAYCLYCFLNPIYVTISNLDFAVYDLFIYGHGDADYQYGAYQLAVGSQIVGTEATTNGPGWLSSVWQLGVQYVEFTNVIVLPGQTINIQAEPVGSFAIISGLQMAFVNQDTLSPIIGIQPTNQTTAQGLAEATFGVLAIGAPPLRYQWLFNGNVISGATNSTYTVTNAQPTNAGGYSVLLSNALGSVTSATAQLMVLPPSAPLIDVAFTGGPATSKTGFAATGITSNDFWNTYSLDSVGSLADLDLVDLTPSGVGLILAQASGVFQDDSSDPMYSTCVYAFETDIIAVVSNLAPGAYNFFLYGHANPDEMYGVFHLYSGAQDYGTQTTTTGSNWLSPTWQEGVQYVEFTNVSIYYAGEPVTIFVEPTASAYAVISGLQIQPSGQTSVPPIPVIIWDFLQPTNEQVIQGSNSMFSVVAVGAPPLTYQWLLNAAAISAATNSSYTISNIQPAGAGTYSVIVANQNGSVTGLVTTVSVLARVTNLIDVAFTDAAATEKTGFAATGVTTSDFWNTYRGAALGNLKFVDGTASGANMTVLYANSAGMNGALDPMYGTFLYPSVANTNVSVIVRNLSAGTYNFYIYGHGADEYPGVFEFSLGSQNIGCGETDSTNWPSSFWQEGLQYEEFSNIVVNPGEIITIAADLISGLQMAFVGPLPSGAFIISQPEGRAATQGASATFSVAAGGLSPLKYQWLFDGAAIVGATKNAYTVADAQLANAGSYSVVVTNTYGSVTSTTAALTIVQSLIDVAFTGASVTAKRGFAATGLNPNDFWNTDSGGPLPNLRFVNGTKSGTGLTVANVDYSVATGSFDPMYCTSLGTINQDIFLTITNLSEGSYDFYLYGHGSANTQNATFDLWVGAQSYGPEATSTNSDWFSSTWQEGVQYVEFTNVGVSAGQTVTISSGVDADGYALISGMQMANKGALSSPYFVLQPTNQTVAPGGAATLRATAAGAPPLAYQWLFNGVNIFAATNSSYAVTNAQPANVGSYSLIAANAYGSVTSAAASLTVLPLMITGISANGDRTVTLGFLTPPNTTVGVFAATNLNPPVFWNQVLIYSNVGASGAWQFTDTNAVNYPETFYRISVP
jgi:hypothetical protein